MRHRALALLVALAALAATDLAPLSPVGEAEGSPLLPEVRLERVASGFTKPLLVTHAGDGSGRLFVVEQPGVVRLLRDGAVDPTPYLDLRHKVRSTGFEQGLLGLAFHPDFETNGRLYASYTDLAGRSVVERYLVADPLAGRPDPSTGSVVITQTQPFSNHNGGHVAFGPDGHLYVGLGDGGSGGDPQGNGQRLSTLLGKMLRIDVDVDEGYRVPADNPFVGQAGARPEIWALGLRNPWRWSFDRATGDLWIADVGQNVWEEVNWQSALSPGGENYGWNEWEGNHPYRAGSPVGKTFPVIEYSHAGGHCSVTGGHVYRGAAVPDLAGAYIYADYCSGNVWFARGVALLWVPRLLVDTPYAVTSFGEDETGELYLVHHGGAIYRFAPA